MFFLIKIVTHFQVSLAVFEHGQSINKQYHINKAILGKMGGVYVINMADVDKGQ